MTKKPGKRGRPAIASGLAKNEKTPIRNLRIPDNEWGRWLEVAKAKKMPLSEIIRRVVSRAMKRMRRELGLDDP